jgi:hypothetical protein
MIHPEWLKLTTGRSCITASNTEGSSSRLGMKVAGLGNRSNVRSLMTIVFLVVALLSFTSVSIARAQTQTNGTSPNFQMITSSTFSSSINTTSPTASYATTSASTSLGSTSSTTLSTSSTNISTGTTSSLALTSTSTTSSSTSYTSINSNDPTVTITTTTTTSASIGSSTTTLPGDYHHHYPSPSSGDYSISFSPAYWLCTDVSVTFTGPLVESELYGDTLQFQYFQYSPSYPSVLYPIFTDPGLTVTSDTVNYWINYNEYVPVNFAYMPNIAVKVVDVTPKSNGYAPGLIFLELTNITPEGGQSCGFNFPTPPPSPVPEFQAAWLMIMASVVLGLVFLQVHKHYRSSRSSASASLNYIATLT